MQPIAAYFSDNADEFVATGKQTKTKHNFSTKYRPESHALIERAVQKVLVLARCLLYQSGLPLCFAEFALLAAAHFPNITNNNRTKTNAWLQRFAAEFTGERHPFGRSAICKLPKEHTDRHKSEPTGEKCIYLGPHLQSGQEWRGQLTIVTLKDLSELEECCESPRCGG